MTEITPQVIKISAFNDIGTKMTFLAKELQSEHDGDTELVYIETYQKTVNDNIVPMIKLSTSKGIWTEVKAYEYSEILEYSVAINLYDFFNAVDQCIDELISLWIDEDTNELVLNSFYNEDKDIDELEVRFKISESKFKTDLTVLQNAKLLDTISIDQMSMHSILSGLNYESEVDGINIVISNGKLSFQSQYNGLDTILEIKSYESDIYSNDVTAYIPFNIFNLMASTGHIEALNVNIYDNGMITLATSDYQFAYKTEKIQAPLVIDISEYNDYCVIDSKIVEPTLKLLNKLNQQAKISTFLIEKVDNITADITCTNSDRYNVSIRTDLAMLSDISLRIDCRIFNDMIKRTGVYAIKILHKGETNVAITFTNRLIKKTMRYNIEEFSNYRNR